MKVNEGATLCHWSDRHAGTVVEVSADGKTLKWQRDYATRSDNNGMSDSQSWAYTKNPETAVKTFTKRKNGYFYERGQKMGTSYLVEGRCEYYDFSF